MKKQTLLIVDRDYLFRKQLIEELKQQQYPAVFWEAGNGLEAVRYINALQPDIVFLGVRLPGISGFEVLDRTEHVPAVVLTSECSSHAVKAFEYDAVDYLLKPLNSKRLRSSLQKLDNQRRAGANTFRDSPAAYPRRMLLEKGNRMTSIPIAEITYLKADKDYTLVHTVHQDVFLSSYGIGQVMHKLDPQQFLRVHRSYIVNVDHIQEMYKDVQKVFLTLPNQIELTVSRNYFPAIKELMF